MYRQFLLAITLAVFCCSCAAPLKIKPTKAAVAKSARPVAKAPVTAQDEMTLATTTLARLNSYTNMSDAQFARVQQATDRLKAGQARSALDILNPLERELRSETKIYVVQSGDSLWSIAAQSDIYANAQLWPLLAQANADLLSKNGYQVQAGQKLRVKLHPTVSESIQAIRDSERGQLAVSTDNR